MRVVQFSTEGLQVMRIILAFAVLAASAMLGGCFHHSQVYSAEALPPPISTRPMK